MSRLSVGRCSDERCEAFGTVRSKKARHRSEGCYRVGGKYTTEGQ